MDDLRAELGRALALADETERKLAVAAVVGLAVRPLGFRAVVIGGLAAGGGRLRQGGQALDAARA